MAMHEEVSAPLDFGRTGSMLPLSSNNEFTNLAAANGQAHLTNFDFGAGSASKFELHDPAHSTDGTSMKSSQKDLSNSPLKEGSAESVTVHDDKRQKLNSDGNTFFATSQSHSNESHVLPPHFNMHNPLPGDASAFSFGTSNTSSLSPLHGSPNSTLTNLPNVAQPNAQSSNASNSPPHGFNLQSFEPHFTASGSNLMHGFNPLGHLDSQSGQNHQFPHNGMGVNMSSITNQMPASQALAMIQEHHNQQQQQHQQHQQHQANMQQSLQQQQQQQAQNNAMNANNNNNNNAQANASSSPNTSNPSNGNNSAPTSSTIVPVPQHSGPNYTDITEYLNMPQNEAAKRLGIPTSTLSKRWKEAVVNRKWPYRTVCKIDKEIMTLLHNIPQGPGAPPLPPEIEQSLAMLLKRRQAELRTVILRL